MRGISMKSRVMVEDSWVEAKAPRYIPAKSLSGLQFFARSILLPSRRFHVVRVNDTEAARSDDAVKCGPGRLARQ